MAKAYILMADVVNSGKKNSRILMKDFKEIVSVVKRKHRGKFLSPITITLGDEFQAIVDTLDTTISIIFSLEEEIIKAGTDIKLKYVVEYGDIDTDINSKIAYEMLGPALTNARNHLLESKKEKDRRVAFFLKDKKTGELLENLFFVTTSIADSWKRKDYPLIKEFIESESYRNIAKKLAKDPSQIWKRQKTLRTKQYIALKSSIQYIAKANL